MSTSQQVTLCDKTPRKYPYHHLRIGLIYTATGIDHCRSTAWYICFSHFSHTGDTDAFGRFKPIRLQVMTSAPRLNRRHGLVVEPTSSLVWTDVILAIFKGLYLVWLYNINTYFSCKAQRVLGIIFMQKSKPPKYTRLPSKVVEVWIDWFCVRYDGWRRLQPTSSLSPGVFCYENNIRWVLLSRIMKVRQLMEIKIWLPYETVHICQRTMHD